MVWQSARGSGDDAVGKPMIAVAVLTRGSLHATARHVAQRAYDNERVAVYILARRGSGA